ncbi:carboxymuconolactone decarboxylase family protein [Gammaproteobacteria bacterium]|nr:carboxymuconolactone decarboxylase family protein [Gammaproteobacteria bacterium]
MPVVAPLAHTRTKEIQELVKFFNETLGFCPNSVLTMQRKPGLAEAFVNLNKAVMKNDSTITSEFKRLIAFVSSNATGCRYCQAHTIRAAERYGSSKERMSEVWHFEDSTHFSEKEKSALAFTIAASKVPQAVTPVLEQNLKRHWSDDEIVEIMGVVALFGYLNRWNDVMATPLEHDAALSAKELLVSWDRGKH